MDIFHCVNGHVPRPLDGVARLPQDGFIWIDCVRDEHSDWPDVVEPLLGTEIERNHVSDSLNAQHRSFFDGTPAYDMLIFAGLGPDDQALPIETRTTAFFLFDRALLTVRAHDSVSVRTVRQRIFGGRIKSPKDPLSLAYVVLDTMVDRFLRIREPLSDRLGQLQDDLLEPGNDVEDWRPLLHGRREARRLEALCEDQLEALDAWRRGTRKPFSNPQSVRVRDLSEHVARVMSLASNQERDLEAAIQLHFAFTASRTNRIMQVLTVFSAIFLPLTFVVGVYGMNFEHMPELHWRYGYFFVLGFMAASAVALLLYFRRKRYF